MITTEFDISQNLSYFIPNEDEIKLREDAIYDAKCKLADVFETGKDHSDFDELKFSTELICKVTIKPKTK